jgi:hypothetical protein
MSANTSVKTPCKIKQTLAQARLTEPADQCNRVAVAIMSHKAETAGARQADVGV